MGILERANQRAQRRLVTGFRRSIQTGTWEPTEARLYVQAERLVDVLHTEAAWEKVKAELDYLQTHDHDWHVTNGVTVGECDDCVADNDGRVAVWEYADIAGMAPGEIVEVYGK